MCANFDFITNLLHLIDDYLLKMLLYDRGLRFKYILRVFESIFVFFQVLSVLMNFNFMINEENCDIFNTILVSKIKGLLGLLIIRYRFLYYFKKY